MVLKYRFRQLCKKLIFYQHSIPSFPMYVGAQIRIFWQRINRHANSCNCAPLTIRSQDHRLNPQALLRADPAGLYSLHKTKAIYCVNLDKDWPPSLHQLLRFKKNEIFELMLQESTWSRVSGQMCLRSNNSIASTLESSIKMPAVGGTREI